MTTLVLIYYKPYLFIYTQTNFRNFYMLQLCYFLSQEAEKYLKMFLRVSAFRQYLRIDRKKSNSGDICANVKLSLEIAV